MKTCTLCGDQKDESCFNKNTSRKDGLQNVCKECNQACSRKYYRENHEKQKSVTAARNRKQRDANRRRMVAYLADKSCVDCGYNKSSAALQFDHVRGRKKNIISRMVNTSFAWDTILTEIAKCEIRCANCHAIKTAKDYGWYSG